MCKGGCKDAWKALPTLVKVLLFCVIFMSIAVVVFFALFLTSLPKKGSGSDNKENQGNTTNDDRQTHHDQTTIATPSPICETQACKDTSEMIRSKIDTSVKPCDDFYQFSCGKWLKNTHLGDNPEITSGTPFPEYVRKKMKMALEEPIQNEEHVFKIVKSYYKGCMDESAMEKRDLSDIKELIKGIGGWPVVDKDQWKEDQFSWTNAMYYLKDRAGGFLTSTLVEVAVMPYSNNTSIISVGQPDVPMREDFVMGITNPKVKAYKEMIIDVAMAFGVDKTYAEKELSDVVEFKIKLNQITSKPVSAVEMYKNVFTIKDLEEKVPSIPWFEYVKAFVSEHVKITKDERLLVVTLTYFEQLGKLLTSKRTVANYIILEAIWKLSSMVINKQVENAVDKFAKTGKQTVAKSRQEKCFKVTIELFPQLTGALYVRDFKEAHMKVLRDMLDNVLEVYTETMMKIDWMDEKTKNLAIEKVKAIRKVAAYFPEQKNYSFLNEIFKTLKVDDKRILLSHANISKFQMSSQFQDLKQPAKKFDSFHIPVNIIETNAFYLHPYNAMVVQAGSLQIPWFGAERPKYINYGSIGSIIGHEYTHGFDISGSQFDKMGDLLNWWVKETYNIFLEKANCYVEQYNKFLVDVNSTMKVNGSRTLNENIADNGGIKHGYLAYKAWVKKHGPEGKLPGLDFTPTQLYFISFAHVWCGKFSPERLEYTSKVDVHAPVYARVVGSIKNSEFFAKEFGCPANSPMNPSHKCVIW